MTQEFIFNRHTQLLMSNDEYKNNHNELLSLLKINEKELSFYNRFSYKLLSQEYKNASLTVKNKNEMKIVQFIKMISTIENKDFFEIKESFK